MIPETIEIKQRHIDQGKREYAKRCPLALALRDKGIKANVYRDRIHVNTDFRRIVVLLSREASEFVQAYDMHRNVEPCQLDLKLSTTRTGDD